MHPIKLNLSIRRGKDTQEKKHQQDDLQSLVLKERDMKELIWSTVD